MNLNLLNVMGTHSGLTGLPMLSEEDAELDRLKAERTARLRAMPTVDWTPPPVPSRAERIAQGASRAREVYDSIDLYGCYPPPKAKTGGLPMLADRQTRRPRIVGGLPMLP